MWIKLLIVCWLVPLLSAVSADAPATQASISEALVAGIYKPEQGDALLYRLARPKREEPGRQYPLILALHGAGARGKTNVKPAAVLTIVSKLTEPASRDAYPCFVLVPQCPANQKWVDMDWTQKSGIRPEHPAPPLRSTIDLLRTLMRENPIDPSRVYVVGQSMGGFGTWDAITRWPELFAAAVPVCGGGDESTVKAIVDIPVWAFHGDADTTVPVERSRNMIEAIRRLGGKPRYTEYAGQGHSVWTQAYVEPKLLPWLFGQHRRP